MWEICNTAKLWKVNITGWTCVHRLAVIINFPNREMPLRFKDVPLYILQHIFETWNTCTVFVHLVIQLHFYIPAHQGISDRGLSQLQVLHKQLIFQVYDNQLLKKCLLDNLMKWTHNTNLLPQSTKQPTQPLKILPYLTKMHSAAVYLW
jgi:hypothetical protein